MSDEQREPFEELYEGEMSVDVQVPHDVALIRRTFQQRDVYGRKSVTPESYVMRRDRIDAWVRELEKIAREFEPKARAVLQPERYDHMGTPVFHVAIWCPPEMDHVGMRRHLYEVGDDFYVTSITHHYTPAMA